MPGAAAKVAVQATTSRHVLVVVDNLDLSETMQLFFEYKGCMVRAAYDGRSALQVIESFCPDAVLLDIRLPDLDGYEVADKLREHPNARHARIVAVIDWQHDVDWARSRRLGFAAHLLKPFDLSDMLDVIWATSSHDHGTDRQ